MSTAIVKKDVIDLVEARVKEFQTTGELSFPPNYSPSNALKSAWLIIQETQNREKKPALSVCTRESVANALLDTVIQGLSPAKNQVYYIVYGNKLVAMRSYFGTMAVTKRLSGVEDVFAQVIYKDDDFAYTIDRGTKKVLKHEQELENIDPKNIVGAYCTIYYRSTTADGTPEIREYTEIMSKAQIDTAWKKSPTKGKGDVHQEFPEEMAKRTVINRTCKMFANTSDDSDLLIESFNRTAGGNFDREAEIEQEIEENANAEVIEGEFEVVEGKPVEEPEAKKSPEKKQEQVPITQQDLDF